MQKIDEVSNKVDDIAKEVAELRDQVKTMKTIGTALALASVVFLGVEWKTLPTRVDAAMDKRLDTLALQKVTHYVDSVKTRVRLASDSIDSLLQSSMKDAKLVARISTAAPDAMIAGFTTSQCPVGWHDFANGKSRFLRGASAESRTGTIGGSASITVALDQMPRHQHAVSMSSDDGSPNGRAYWGQGPAVQPTGQPNNWAIGVGHERPTMMTSWAGGGRAINNMPLYVTVQFCERDKAQN